jgi:hypothetical protein
MKNPPTIPRMDSLLEIVRRVQKILRRAHEASADYFNSFPVVEVPEMRKGKKGSILSWSLPFTVKDICVLGAIAQSPIGLRGDTDIGKTFLGSRILNGLFGPHERGWWCLEVSAGLTEDDLIDVDVGKLKQSTVRESISAVPWVSLPATVLDELNRTPAKLANTILHLLDGSFHVRGIVIPVGMEYAVDGETRRYQFSIATANNQKGNEYDGIYVEDAALLRRVVLQLDLDECPVTVADVVEMVNTPTKRMKNEVREFETMANDIIAVYESLPESVPFSALAHLFLYYLWGLGTCVRTKSERVRKELVPALCEKCHLFKGDPLCGRVGGISEGLLICCKEIARAVAVIRAAKVLERVRKDCEEGRHRQVREFLHSKATGEELFEEFAARYVEDLAVEGEDVVAAYSLIAPKHVWIRKDFLEGEERYEKNEKYAFADIAATSWAKMKGMLFQYQSLFNELAVNAEVSAQHQSLVEKIVTTEAAPMLAVISAFRNDALPRKYREAMVRHRAA